MQDQHNVINVVTDPLGNDLPAQITHEGGKHKLEFTPMVVGSHLITVLYNGVHVKGSPFPCNVFDAGKVGSAVIFSCNVTDEIFPVSLMFGKV